MAFLQDSLGKPVRDFTGARDDGVAVAAAGPYTNHLHLTSHNHASTSPLSFSQAGCPSCHAADSVKALRHPVSPTNTNQNPKMMTCDKARCLQQTTVQPHNDTMFSHTLGALPVGSTPDVFLNVVKFLIGFPTCSPKRLDGSGCHLVRR